MIQEAAHQGKSAAAGTGSGLQGAHSPQSLTDLADHICLGSPSLLPLPILEVFVLIWTTPSLL